MAEKIYKNNYEISSPFIIEQDQLKKLENITEKEWPNLLEYKENKIKKVASEKFSVLIKQGFYESTSEEEKKEKLEQIEKETRQSYSFHNEEIRLTLFFKDGNSIKLKSFSEGFKNRDINETKIIGFNLDVDCGEVSSVLECDPHFEKMKLRTRPQDLRISNELFLEFKRWIDMVRAPIWQRIVRKTYPFHWFLLLFVLIYAALFGGINKESPEWLRMEQAHKLLQDGIEEDEHEAALEEILALLSDYEKPKAIILVSSWYKLIVISGIITCILLSFIPKTVLGIGKDERRVKMWRKYLNFISVTIPILIFSSFIWPQIQSWVISFF